MVVIQLLNNGLINIKYYVEIENDNKFIDLFIFYFLFLFLFIIINKIERLFYLLIIIFLLNILI